MNSSIKNRWTVAVVSFMAVVLSAFYAVASVEQQAIGNEVDAVWSTSDGIRLEIFYSQQVDGVWTEPVQITDDHYDNMYPVVDKDSTGKRWIFWTAYNNGRMELHYATGKDDNWETSDSLTAEMKTNIAPSVVIDEKDTVWVTWSANDGKLDDILYAYNENNSWSGPELLHEANDQPDILPEIELDPNGIPMVNWQSRANGNYKRLISRWLGDDWSEPMIQPVEEKEGSDVSSEKQQLALPPSLNKSSLVFIRVY